MRSRDALSATRSHISRRFSRRCSSIITSASRSDVRARLCAFAFALSFALTLGCDRGGQQFQVTDVTGANFGKTLELTDHTGKRRTLEDFKGKVVAILFGF